MGSITFRRSEHERDESVDSAPSVSGKAEASTSVASSGRTATRGNTGFW